MEFRSKTFGFQNFHDLELSNKNNRTSTYPSCHSILLISKINDCTKFRSTIRITAARIEHLAKWTIRSISQTFLSAIRSTRQLRHHAMATSRFAVQASRTLRSRPLLPAGLRSRSYATDNPVTVNDPDPKPPAPNVSGSNEAPTSSTSASDKALQESPEEGERRRLMQAPNREGIWSKSQRPRSQAMVGPRFEQAIMETQVGIIRFSNLRVARADAKT